MITSKRTPEEYHQFFKTTEYNKEFMDTALNDKADIADIIEAISRFVKADSHILRKVSCEILINLLISQRRQAVNTYMQNTHHMDTTTMPEKMLSSIFGVEHDVKDNMKT
jgi:hypothetical protein